MNMTRVVFIPRFSSGAAQLSSEVIKLMAKTFPKTVAGKPYGQTSLK